MLISCFFFLFLREGVCCVGVLVGVVLLWWFCSSPFFKGGLKTQANSAIQTRNVIFRNPDTAAGATEPVIKLKDE